MQLKAPYLIAEIGVNFYDIAAQRGLDPLDAAKLMIREAKAAGADAAKFQVYKAEKIAVKNSPAYWDLTQESTASQYELFKKFDHFGEAEYRALADYCRTVGIEFLSTPFDLDAVDVLDPLVRHFKVASADLTNIPLQRRIAQKGKPVFLSAGGCTIGEIEKTLSLIRDVNPTLPVTIMHCVLSYPTENRHANLQRIRKLKEIFPRNAIGYSDHTLPDPGMAILTTAWLLGALVIEKHFTLDKALPGNDHYHAMDPDDLRKFRQNVATLQDAFSADTLNYQACEEVPRRQARRSIVTKRAMRQGEVIREEDLIMKRPGTGIEPEHLSLVVGRTLRQAVSEDTILEFPHLV